MSAPIHASIKEYCHSFARLEDSYWEGLEKVLVERRLSPRELYSKEGDFTKNIGFLKEGVLRIYYLDDDGTEWNKTFCEPPEIVLANVDMANKATTYIEAITDCVIIESPVEYFFASQKIHPNLAIIQTKLMAELIEQKSQREADLLSLNAKERYLKFKKNSPHLIDIIPQYHLASYLGITPTQLSRIKLSFDQQM